MYEIKKPLLALKLGFSLIELLTVLSIIGVLSTIGIRSYLSQVGRARTAEAKHSLSTVYRAEKQFHLEWRAYHENLVVVGVTPDASYHYDVGFHQSAPLSATDGRLRLFPAVPLLSDNKCTNWKQICDGLCTAGGYFQTSYFNCTVTGQFYIKDMASSGTTTSGTSYSSFEATENAFKAIATGKIRGNDDLWSIDHSRNVEHEIDALE